MPEEYTVQIVWGVVNEGRPTTLTVTHRVASTSWIGAVTKALRQDSVDTTLEVTGIKRITIRPVSRR